ncbi:MAG: GNAT family protein [Betaproteobacteria bacterium]
MIKGKYTSLRAIEIEDLAQLLVWRNKPEMRRYFREYRELNNAQQIHWFEQKVNNDISTRMFSILDSGGKLIGAAGLCFIDWVNRSADFSIYIGLDGLYIDTKFAPDAATAMINYGFGELGLHRIWCEIYSFDLAKIKFLKQLGFNQDGKHRESHWSESKWHDSLFYGLLSTDPRPQEKI